MARKRPVMTVFAGPNGAGKSTLRELLKNNFPLGVEIDADAIAKQQNLSDFQAGRETIQRVDECIQEGVSFSLETTLSGKTVFDQMQRAKEQGFEIRLLFISLDEPIDHRKRVEQRVSRGGHAIPADDIERRFHRSHENLSKAIFIVDEANVYTNAAKCETAARFEHGKIVERAAKVPVWADRILNQFDGRAAAKITVPRKESKPCSTHNSLQNFGKISISHSKKWPNSQG